MTDTNRKPPHILYVEDDPNLAFATKDNLELEGYTVEHCENGLIAIEKFNNGKYDLCVLDIMLPELDGFSLAKMIREINTDIPIIFLSARSMQVDKIQGLQLGADDYLTKPFSMQELILKIEVFLRRSKKDPILEDGIFKIGSYTFDFQKLTLRLGDKAQSLTFREGEVLRYFALHRNEVVRREELLKAIWGDDDYYMGRSLDVFISRLRKYLSESDDAIRIDNVHGVGFRMTW